MWVDIILLAGWFLTWFNSPSYELGRLEKDIEVGYFTGETTKFILLKGFTVKNK